MNTQNGCLAMSPTKETKSELWRWHFLVGPLQCLVSTREGFRGGRRLGLLIDFEGNHRSHHQNPVERRFVEDSPKTWLRQAALLILCMGKHHQILVVRLPNRTLGTSPHAFKQTGKLCNPANLPNQAECQIKQKTTVAPQARRPLPASPCKWLTCPTPPLSQRPTGRCL